MEKPPFDPTLPHQSIELENHPIEKPAFDPNAPFEPAQESLSAGLKTAAEQFVSGFTIGASEAFETRALGINPEDIEARRESYPILSSLANIAGGVALFGTTGGLGRLVGLTAESALGAKLGVQALEGAAIGGATQVTDSWSKNQSLDAEKIFAHAKLGSALGLAGGVFGEGIAKIRARNKSFTGVSTRDNNLKESIQPTTLKDLKNTVNAAQKEGLFAELPQRKEVEDSLSRIQMKYPVFPGQLESLENSSKRDMFQILKETPTEDGAALKNYETLQKYHDLIPQLKETINTISPGYTPTENALEAGERAAQYFADSLVPKKEQLGKAIGALKKTNVDKVEHLPGVIGYLTRDNLGLSRLFRFGEKGLEILPYDGQLPIARKVYDNIVDTVKSINKNNPSIEGLFNLRENLFDGINKLEASKAQSQLEQARASMMSYIQDLVQQVTPDVKVRQTFADYAKTQEAIQFIEKRFGAQVGTKEWISKARNKAEENILDKIFKDSASTEYAKQILPKEDFNKILADYVNITRQNAINPATSQFSSNKFLRAINSDQYALESAFQDNPGTLQRITDLARIIQAFPDAAPVVVGSGKTNLAIIKKLHLKDLSILGLVNNLPKHVINGLNYLEDKANLNRLLTGESINASESNYLQKSSQTITDRVDKDIKSLFSGATGELTR